MNYYKQYKLYKNLSDLSRRLPPEQEIFRGSVIYNISDAQVNIYVTESDIYTDYDADGAYYRMTIHSNGQHRGIPTEYKNQGVLARAVFNLLKRRHTENIKRAFLQNSGRKK